MAAEAPLLTRQRVLAAKVETDTGTPETLLAANGAMNIFNTALTPEYNINEREGQSALSRLPSVPGPQQGSMTFETELSGLGGVGNPLWAETFLLASGFAESSQVFTPTTGLSTAPTLTLGSYEDGNLRRIYGAAGTWTMNFAAGNPVRTAWEFTGVFDEPTAAALLTPTYPTVIPPRFASATLTVGGTAFKVSSMAIAANNVISLREDAADATGYHAAVVVDRRVTVTMDPEAQLHGTKNWYTDILAGTEAALNVVVGATANNIITIACPKLQLTNVQSGDRNGIQTKELEFQANRSAAAGDDEISITFS